MSFSTISASRQDYTKRIKDVVGRLKVSVHQNVYEADFEYGKQPLRWEEYAANGGSISHLPGIGACSMYLPASTPNAITIRQSRPYHRYQPGKAMFMASAINFGVPASNQYQRVGFFDDSNGAFFEQGPTAVGNPNGMAVVLRSDTNYWPANGASGTTGNPAVIQEVRVTQNNWSNPHNIPLSDIDWSKIQMIWIEYAWYGAGCIRWGIFINGEQYILHEIGAGNNGTYGGGQIGNTTGQAAWARTGNLPVRYEQRDSGSSTSAATMYHYGVSVIVEGGRDAQRGFTYSYGMDPATPRRYVQPGKSRFPVLSIQPRVMGTQEFSIPGGPAASQAPIITGSSTSQLVVDNTSTPSLPAVTGFYGTGSVVTLTFKTPHGLPVAGGNVVISGAPSGPPTINGTQAYSYQSPATITFNNTTLSIDKHKYKDIVVKQTAISWVTNQWAGRSVYYLGQDKNFYTAKISSNSSNYLTIGDPIQGLALASPPAFANSGTLVTNVTPSTANTATYAPAGGSAVPVAGDAISSIYLPLSTTITSVSGASSPYTITLNNSAIAAGNSTAYLNSYYTIGQTNRGQLLPQTLLVSSDSLCVVELIASTPGNPVVLTGGDFQPLYNLGSPNSFATRDVAATAMTGGEVVFAFVAPAGGGGLQSIDLSQFFPLYNSLLGNVPDILCVAVSTKSVALVAPELAGISISGSGANTKATLTFSDPHGLNPSGDTMTLSGFTGGASAWDGTYTITSTPTINKAVISVAANQTPPTGYGAISFSVGANVGAHLICQEAMS